MKNILFIILLFFSVSLFAQENNDTTQKIKNLQKEIVSLKKSVSSLNHKLNTLKFYQKKSKSEQSQKFDKISLSVTSSTNNIKNNSNLISKANNEINLLKKENEELKQLISDRYLIYKISIFILLLILISLFIFNRVSILKIPKKIKETIVETKQEVDIEIQSVKVGLTKEVKNTKKSINKISKELQSISEKE